MVTDGFVYQKIEFNGYYGNSILQFPVHQPGASSIIGFFSIGQHYYVAKLLRTRYLDNSKFGRIFTEPLIRRCLKHLPVKSNPLSPTPKIVPVVDSYIKRCKEQLLNIDHRKACSAIASMLNLTKGDCLLLARLAGLTLELGLDSMDLFPRSTYLTIARIPVVGVRTLALIQEDITSGRIRPSVYQLKFPISSSHLTAVDASFVILCALAVKMSREYGIGIDLFPHVDNITSRVIKFPNVLLKINSSGIAYVDTFGLFSKEGNIPEQLGNDMLYSKHGIIPILMRRMINVLLGVH